MVETYYVYFIQKGYGSVKIGVAKNPEARLKILQTGNHGELHLIAKLPFKSRPEAYTMEKELHKRFEKFKLTGEWFRKRILKEFKHRAKIFPQIFRSQFEPGECFNSYNTREARALHLSSESTNND